MSARPRAGLAESLYDCLRGTLSRLKKPKKGTGVKYGDIFGSLELGELIVAVHRTSISSGYELEEVINNLIPATITAETGVPIIDHSNSP